MTTRPISYDKNQALDQQVLELIRTLFPNRLQLVRVKALYQARSTVCSSGLHPQPRYK